MKTVLIILSLSALSMAAQDAPLKCGPYQHVYHWPGPCGPADCNENGCLAVCYPPPPDKCVDDMHEITEKEWQQVMARLEKLERQIKGEAGASF